MKHIKQWYCRGCRTVRDREFFPKHIDAETRCLDCQRNRDTAPTSTTSGAPRLHVIRVRGNRRHSDKTPRRPAE